MVQFIIGPPIIKGFATITFFFITYMTRSETWSNKPSLHKVLVIDHSKKCNNFAQFHFLTIPKLKWSQHLNISIWWINSSVFSISIGLTKCDS